MNQWRGGGMIKTCWIYSIMMKINKTTVLIFFKRFYCRPYNIFYLDNFQQTNRWIWREAESWNEEILERSICECNFKICSSRSKVFFHFKKIILLFTSHFLIFHNFCEIMDEKFKKIETEMMLLRIVGKWNWKGYFGNLRFLCFLKFWMIFVLNFENRLKRGMEQKSKKNVIELNKSWDIYILT